MCLLIYVLLVHVERLLTYLLAYLLNYNGIRWSAYLR